MQFIQFTAARADTGSVLPRAKVTVYLTGTSTKAALFDALGSSVPNPVTADATGLVGLAANNGTYDAAIVSSDGVYTSPGMLKLQLFDLAAVAQALASGTVAGLVSKVKDTRANLNADLAAAANTLGLVYADGTAANNDLYVKLGASGSGSWQGPLGIVSSQIAASVAAAQAAAAAAGSRINSGTGAPANSLYYDNDYYISTDLPKIYGPKASGVWPSGVSLVGTPGPSAFQVAVAAGFVGTQAQWLASLSGTPGTNGGVGSSAGNAALFTAAAGMAIGTGITSFRTAGYSVAGKGGAEYIYDAAVNSAYVTANPRASFLAADGRGFRLAPQQRLNVAMFGAIGDFVTDDLAAFNAAMAALPTGGGELKIPAGRYYLSDTLNLHKTAWLIGEGTNWNGDGSTIIRFPPNVNGIVINHNNTHSDGDGTQGTATGSTVEGIVLWGGNIIVNGAGAVTAYSGGNSTSGHGVRIRTTGVKLRDVNCAFFGGDGFNVECFAGSSGYFQGNANNFEIAFCQSIYNRGNGYFFKGTDVNAGKISICSAISCGGGGFLDYSFLGNTYDACHVRDCGKVDPVLTGGPVGCCTYGGASYYVVQGQEAAASTTVPGTNSAVWVAQGNYAQKAWVTGLTWRNGSSYGTDLGNVNARNVFTGCYGESSQIPVQAAAPSLFQGGLLDEVGFSPQSSAPWVQGLSGAIGAPAFRTTNYLSGTPRYTWVGPAGGISQVSDIFGHNDGTYISRLYDNGNGLQLDVGGGAVWRSDSPVAAVPNLFTARQLKICGVADINGGNRVAYASAAPTTGAWTQGAIVFNEAPSSGTLLWVCTASGTPGTWTAVAVSASTAPNVQAVTSAATVTPVFGNDLVKVTAQAVALALANPTGTAVSGAGLAIRVKDNGTARAITFGTQYRAIGVTLPTTTVATKTLYLGLIYNADDTKWDVVAVAQEA